MKLQIESEEEARVLAEALKTWIHKCLEMSGHLHPVALEDRYYVTQRAAVEALATWIKSA